MHGAAVLPRPTFRLVLLLAGLLLLATCAAEPVLAQRTVALGDALVRRDIEPLIGGEVPELPPPGYLGWTGCRAGVPITQLDSRLDSLTLAEVRYHEQFHRLQLAVGCDSIVAIWRHAGREYAVAEAEAQCFAWHALGYAASTVARSIEREATNLMDSIRVPTVTRDSLVEYFRRACG